MILAWIQNLEIPIASLIDWLNEVDADHNGKVSVRELMTWVKGWYDGH